MVKGQSVWSKYVKSISYPPLSGDISADAVVIGGGMAGVLTAYLLEQNEIDTVLLEADIIGGGQTKNTTAKITAQHGLIYKDLIKADKKNAQNYAEANMQAVDMFAKIIKLNKIDCDFERLPSFMFSLNKNDILPLKKEAQAAKQLGFDAEFTLETELPFEVAGAVKFNNQAQFHPLKFLYTLADKIKIYENTRVKSVDGTTVYTQNGTVTTKHIIFATHYPFIDAPGFYFTKMYQERSCVIALKNAAKVNGMYLGAGKEGLSVRNAGDLLLLGGGDYRTGENSRGGKYLQLEETAKALWPKSVPAAYWSAQDCMTPDALPYIGKYSALTPDWYVATGFGKWGMTGSMVSAMLITDSITGKESRYLQTFSPARPLPARHFARFFGNLGQAVKGLFKRVFCGPAKNVKSLPNGHGAVLKYKGKKAGIYKDESGKIFAVDIKCPHLGCQLSWNADEKSWDCPCHGSRFTYKGELIDNPAAANLKCKH